MSDENGWVVGAECSEWRSHISGGHWGPIVSVEKVYKNGNVVIQGEQYRPRGDVAHPAGDWRYLRHSFYLMTTGNRAKRDADFEMRNRSKRVRAAGELVNEWKRWPENFPDRLLALIEEIAAEKDAAAQRRDDA